MFFLKLFLIDSILVAKTSKKNKIDLFNHKLKALSQQSKKTN